MKATRLAGLCVLVAVVSLEAHAQQLVGLGTVGTGVCVGAPAHARQTRLTAVVEGARLPGPEPLEHCLRPAAAELGLHLLASEPVKASPLLRDRSNACLSRLGAGYRIDQVIVRAESSC